MAHHLLVFVNIANCALIIIYLRNFFVEIRNNFEIDK